MKSIQAEFEKTSKKITIAKDAKEEDWASVCRKFNDDVSSEGAEQGIPLSILFTIQSFNVYEYSIWTQASS